MRVLILGASGATGRLAAHQLAIRNVLVRAIVRATSVIPARLSESENIEIIKGSINDYDSERMRELVKDCDAVISCLGHNISFKGILGPPRKLVYNAVKKITDAIKDENRNIKFILMSTTAYTNKKNGELNTFGEKVIFSLLKVLLPPHKDNMLAGDHLIYDTGAKSGFEWVAVRPDSLIDEEKESAFELLNNKKRSPIFDPGKTSRINVGCFMAELLTNEELWKEWKFKTPVIYNKQ